MGAAGRERVNQRFSMPAMVATYQGLYDQLCDRLSRPTKRSQRTTISEP
jgi:hypothetical protein